MLYERRLESRTRGLVHGPSLITSAMPWPAEAVHWKVVIASRESGEVLWARPFAKLIEAQRVYLRLTGLEPQYRDREIVLPHPFFDGELTYYIATVATFNITTNDASADWTAGGTKCPAGVTAVDYLLLAGGGGGGMGNASFAASGGGAGGLLAALGLPVTPGTNYPVTIGVGGLGATAVASRGGDGVNSTWNGLTALKGGGGGSAHTTGAQGGGGSGTFGCGGGSGVHTSGTATTGGLGTAGQGFKGGDYPSVGSKGGGGGGTAGAGVSSGTVNGGPGTSSAISGLALFYGGGGGGALSGVGGSSIGGNGGTAANVPGTAASPANRGSGGGAGGTNAVGGRASDGVAILSFIGGAAGPTTFPNLAMMGM